MTADELDAKITALARASVGIAEKITLVAQDVIDKVRSDFAREYAEHDAKMRIARQTAEATEQALQNGLDGLRDQIAQAEARLREVDAEIAAREDAFQRMRPAPPPES